MDANWIIENWNIVLFVGGLILYIGRQKILLEEAKSDIKTLKSTNSQIQHDLVEFKLQISELKTELSFSREYQGNAIEKIEKLVVRVLDNYYDK